MRNDMDYANERRFVAAFIVKDRRKRLLHELTTPAKRYGGLSRFCHQAEELLDPAKMLMEGEDLDRLPEFERFVARHDEPCYVMSPDARMDGRTLATKDAVNEALMCLDAVIILGSSFAIVFGEPLKGGRGKFLLSEE